MKEITGVITSADGEGFELETGEGNEHFSLGMDVVLEAGPLPELVEKRAEVTVQYHDIPDETSHVALRIFPAMHPKFFWQTH